MRTQLDFPWLFYVILTSPNQPSDNILSIERATFGRVVIVPQVGNSYLCNKLTNGVPLLPAMFNFWITIEQHRV